VSAHDARGRRSAPVRFRLPVVVLAVTLAIVAGNCSRDASREAGSGSRAGSRPIALIGLDAADWARIDPLIAAGALPTFARLKSHGRTGVLIATPPLVSPIIWTTIATGMQPEDHGVLDFMTDLRDGRQAPVGSAQRLAPAIWNLFSANGRRADVVGWWATWPAERLTGTIVSDALAPQLLRVKPPAAGGIVSPPDAESAVNARLVHPSALQYADLARYVPLTQDEFRSAQRAFTSGEPTVFYKDKLAHLAAVIAGTRTYTGVALDLWSRERPDLLAVYLEEIDTLSHLFIGNSVRGPKAIEAAYRDADQLISQLAQASPPDTLIVVVSDHGFHSTSAGIKEDPADLAAGPATAWHRPYGVIAVATAGALTGRPVDPARTVAAGEAEPVSPIDIAPTLLQAANLPITREMPGRVVTSLLPPDAAARPPVRVAAQPYRPPSAIAGGDAGDAWARLQALGYVGGTRTSLARQHLAESYFRRGKLEAAVRELNGVLETQPNNLTALLWLAKSLAGLQRTSEALAVYDRAMFAGAAPDALVEAVDLALAAGQKDRARGLVRSASAKPGAGSALAVARGAIAEAEGQPKVAEQQYRAALAADSGSFDALARLFGLLTLAGRAPELLPALSRAAAQLPDSARHQALLGEAQLAAKDYRAAESSLTRALQLAPDADAVRISLARVYLMQQQPNKAVSVLATARPSADRNVLLGAAYSASGDWNNAATHLQSALDDGRVTPEVLNGLGYSRLKLGQRQQAAELFTRSLELKPAQPEIRKLLGDLKQDAPRAVR
jgi:tetratricopeptide (TPR) repeat protein